MPDEPPQPDAPDAPDTPKKRPAKATAAEVALRVEEVLRIVLDGAQYHDVLQYAAEKGWDLKERQVREYMSRASDLLVERQEKKRKRLVALHLARRDALYARAVNAADYRTALAVLSDAAKLQGLYPVVQAKIEVPNVLGDLIREAVRHDLDARNQSHATGGDPGQPAAVGGCGSAPDVENPETPRPD